MFINKTILFIYAHLDDETILSHGTLQKLSQNNTVIVATLCKYGRKYTINNDRYISYKKILNSLNINYITYDNYDLTLTSNSIHTILDEIFTKYNPEIIFTHSQKDLHFEHRLISENVLLWCRTTAFSNINALYTTVSQTYTWTHDQYGHFNPTMYINISNYIIKKIMALKLYSMELPYIGDNRSISSILTWNKMHGNTIGVKYAEPYEQIFSII